MTTYLGQRCLPRGLAGWLFGSIIRRYNRAENVWTLSLLPIGEGKRALEAGFGPADAIRLAAAAAPSCRIARRRSFRDHAAAAMEPKFRLVPVLLDY